jgi:hypothetical protein
MPVIWVLAAIGCWINRAEGRRSYRCLYLPCGSGLLAAIFLNQSRRRAALLQVHRILRAKKRAHVTVCP